MVGVRSQSSLGDAKKVDGSDATSKNDRTDDKGGGDGRLVEDQSRLSTPEKSSECQTANGSTKCLFLWRSSILILSISSILFCAYLAHRQVQTDQEIQLLKAELRQLHFQQQRQLLQQQQPAQESSSWRIKREARMQEDTKESDCKCVGLPGPPGPPGRGNISLFSA